MAGQKTVPTSTDIDSFIAAIPDERRRADAQTLVELMGRVTGEPPILWGSMVGFGRYHYRYASGHEGDTFLIGFAPRKNEFSIYLSCLEASENEECADLFARLGKHRMGKGCLYVNKIADIDLNVLQDLVRVSIATIERMYPSK
ncbi:DUF1801 domain-containing protein [Devosia nitrariae]|uniref:YdhG-like domain-containing protein n=1 Tax=Devosia nitrariae TaxID=2071872 RepID=A0ABQ5WD38_9HYPH|nr:DUF1801 domain-containing protein [Devosia nitrariae]GLQ57783.1 hypothetical protein GCM10010862_50420 [Devosia nitrariae]